MCDPFADTGILENLLLSEHLTLESKRNMLLVSWFFHEYTDAHLRLPELHVDYDDCTIANARFVVRKLAPRVPGLRLCARGERFAPKMDLAKLARFAAVIAHATDCSMDATAAFFLGHALATSDGFVRLGTGRKKSLVALRERDHLELDIYEQTNTIDLLLMKPCLLANAERRLKAFMYAKLYYHSEQTETARKANAVIVRLWQAYCEDPSRMGPQWESVLPQDEPHRSRHIADYIAGMSDKFALERMREIYGHAPDDISNV